MEWNTNISEAPKSYIEVVHLVDGDGFQIFNKDGSEKLKKITHDVFIWVAYEGVNGPTTGMTKWLPKSERWEGFKADGPLFHGFISLPSYEDFAASRGDV